uniref:Uncharacterized protein n=1 Tax=Cacopsylla melanoneura TaxID=428564 RepID=A0A8D8R4E8_9HEMI
MRRKRSTRMMTSLWLSRIHPKVDNQLSLNGLKGIIQSTATDFALSTEMAGPNSTSDESEETTAGDTPCPHRMSPATRRLSSNCRWTVKCRMLPHSSGDCMILLSK